MTRRTVLCLTVLAALVLPSLAQANAYRDVLAAYQSNGAVPPCRFSSHKLSAAIKEEDTYDAQYFADFTNSIETALESRASGQCPARGSSASLAPSPEGGLTGGPTAPGDGLHLGSLTAATGSGIPAPIVLMGLIVLAVGLVGVGVGLAGSGGWDPAWAAAWRHGLGEAGYRLSAILADFRDWRRSSRHRHRHSV
ncbi:MAG: hypothetical protein M3Z06_00705 [Actinomycetota bacterium]|nr:hypothetical protein [Actinomycetota bacterium]